MICQIPGCYVCAASLAPVVVPGLPQRAPGATITTEESMRRPDYVPADAHYAPLPGDYRYRRGFRRRRGLRAAIILAVVALALLLTAAVALADDPIPQEPTTPPGSSAPKQDVPPPPCPPDEC